jgi:hypothetical protein
MPTFRYTLDIRAEPLALFQLSQDYARRLAWDPFLREARLLGGATSAAVGVRSWCVARGGLGMETEYVTYDPPRVVAVRMTRGPRILARFAGAWRFETVAPGVTRVTFSYALAARPAWLRFALDPLLAAVLGREMRRRLVALRRAAETSVILRASDGARTAGSDAAGRDAPDARSAAQRI